MTTATYPESYCCDGTGWTGDPHEICVEHYEPVDPTWLSADPCTTTMAESFDEDYGDWAEAIYDPDGPSWLD